MYNICYLYRIDGTHCCSGFKWDLALKICKACEYGFWGINCNFKCPYPMYGKKCQYWCFCDVHNCHHVNGCIQPTQKYKVQTEDMSYKTTTKEHIEMYNVISQKDISNDTPRDIYNDTTNISTNPSNHVCETKETLSKRTRSVMFGVIGLTGLSFIICTLNLNTRVLEKRLLNTTTV